jgi:hypothetical protein
MSTHEDLSRKTAVTGSSDRTFGLTWVVFLEAVGLWPLIHGRPIRLWAMGAGAALFLVALVRPSVLAPLNRLWMRLGLILHRITSPIVMGLMFYGVITPIGLIRRGFGWDVVRRGFDRGTNSYWIERRPPGPRPETMSKQF